MRELIDFMKSVAAAVRPEAGASGPTFSRRGYSHRHPTPFEQWTAATASGCKPRARDAKFTDRSLLLDFSLAAAQAGRLGISRMIRANHFVGT